MSRGPLQISLAVWRALFLREALDRLFGVRFSWCWLLLEPVLHISFTVMVFSVFRVKHIGNADTVVWLATGLVTFILFQRTASQCTGALGRYKGFNSYRQVKPFDVVMVRAVLEALLLFSIAVILIVAIALIGHQVVPHDPLMVLLAVWGLWIFALGYGIIASVCIKMVPESQHTFGLLMIPMYIISGVILPLAQVPMPYREWILMNPVAHSLELVRLGYFTHYHAAAGVSMAYLYASSVLLVFLGLLLYRRFHLHLIMR